jgi:hypothetical protein
MKTLRISKDLDLPLDAVTQKLAWLGRTGSGKTFACKKMVEQMLHACAQVVILDGAGVWAGLRLGPKRFDIPVLGGLYGDIPLESTAGALVADVIVDRGTSIILDVSQMLDAERTRFATAFAQQFFQRKKAKPGAVHLVLEECQDFVPENEQRGEERMLHEFQRLAKQGRSHGVGMSFISQRPQEISKKALNQVECVFAFQMTGPHERKALQYWLSDKGMGEKLETILPRLEVGAPHVWSPQWLKISKVVHILPIETLDTSRTPKVGERAFAQKKLEPINLEELTAAMTETVERAKLEDPKMLRARIAELEKELAKKRPATKLESWEMVVDSRNLKEALEVTENLEKELTEFQKSLEHIRRVNNGADGALRHSMRTGTKAPAKRLAKVPVPPATPPPTRTSYSAASGTIVQGGGLRRMMIALAQRPGLTNRQLGVRAGLSSRSGTFSTYLSRGRAQRWIIDEGDRRMITRDGVEALGHFEPLPEGNDLLNYWLNELGGGANRMLAVLADTYPKGMSNDELGAAAGISARSGTFSTYLSRLRTLELVEGERGQIRMSEELA